MNKFLAVLLAGFFGTASFAASHTGAPMSGTKPVEAMKPGDPKSEAAAQAKVGKKNSTDEQMKKDAAKL